MYHEIVVLKQKSSDQQKPSGQILLSYSHMPYGITVLPATRQILPSYVYCSQLMLVLKFNDQSDARLNVTLNVTSQLSLEMNLFSS